jgi:hypothetical protein
MHANTRCGGAVLLLSILGMGLAPEARARLVDLTLGNLNCPDAFTIRANSDADPSLNHARFIGDFNGDGRTDIALGSPLFDPVGFPNGGRACVVYRPATCTPSIDLAAVANGVGGFCMFGNASNIQLGVKVAPLGDINSDGRTDVATFDLQSRSSIVFGTTTPFGGPLTPASLNGSNGFTIGRQLAAPSAIGDFNGDGIDDFAVGLFSPYRLCVVFGRTTGFPASIDPSPSYFNGSNGFCMLAPSGSTAWAAAVSGLKRRPPPPPARGPVAAGGGQAAYLSGSAMMGGGQWLHGLVPRFAGPYSANYNFAATPGFRALSYGSDSLSCFVEFGVNEVSGIDTPVATGCWGGNLPSRVRVFPSADALAVPGPPVDLLSNDPPDGGMRFDPIPGSDIDFAVVANQAGGLSIIVMATSAAAFNPGADQVYAIPFVPNGTFSLDQASLAALPLDVVALKPLTAGELVAEPDLAWDGGELLLSMIERQSDSKLVLRVLGNAQEHLFPVADCVYDSGFEDNDDGCPL